MMDETQTDPNLTAILPAEYKVVQKLGEGGSGQVYKALYGSLDRYVAVKVLHVESQADGGKEGSRLLKEAKALSSLDHPNIVKVMTMGTAANGSPFLVYEYLEGETLQSHLSSGKRLPPKFLSMLSEQLCQALDYLHGNKFVHRDIKPGNIMILPAESRSVIHVKLLDFGLAKDTAGGGGVKANGAEDSNESADSLSAARAAATATATAHYRGSPAYMSPEQCQGTPVDLHSDIYSLGCVVYECLLGRLPFTGDSVYDVLYQHIHSEPQLSDKTLSADMRNVLKRALAKDRAARYASAGEFNNELQKAIKQMRNSEPAKFPLHILLAAILISSIAAGFIATQSAKIGPPQKGTESPSTANLSRTKHQGLLKPYMLLEEVWSRDGQATTAVAKRQMIHDVELLMPSLKTPEELFVAYDIMGDKYHALEDPVNATRMYQFEYQQAGKRKDKNGLLPVDAAKPLIMLARLKLDHKDMAEAEYIIKEALDIFLKQDKDYCYRLKPPFDYDCMNLNAMFSASYSTLADVEAAQKKYKLAEEHEKLAMNELAEPYYGSIAGYPYLRLANFFYADGKKHSAYQTFDEVLQELKRSSETKAQVFNDQSEINSMFDTCSEIAWWYYAHHEYKRAYAMKAELEFLASRFSMVKSKYEEDKDLKALFAECKKLTAENQKR
jgi:serine/threonine protein kinase